MFASPCRFVPSLGGLLLATSLAAAEETPQTQPYGERIEVRAVNVEAVVTDRRGNRVSGLSAGDFELLVDGKPMPLEYFLEVRDGRAVVPAGSGEGVRPDLPAAAGQGDAVGHSYLVFIDETTSPIVVRKAALRQLAGEIDRLGPADRMAVVALNEKGLTVLTPWSQSRAELDAALKAAQKRTGYFRPYEATAADRIEPFVIGKLAERLQHEKLRFADFERMIQHAAQSERDFAGVPGRKVMLLLSGQWIGQFQRVDVRAGLEAVRPLTDTSNLLGYTVYPVQLETVLDTMPGAERRHIQGNRGLNMFLEDQMPKAFAAEETGGRLLNVAQSYFTKATEDLSSYYWLSFAADDSDGRRRTVEVRVKGRDDLEVRTRSSYLPLSQQADASPRTGSKRG